MNKWTFLEEVNLVWDPGGCCPTLGWHLPQVTFQFSLCLMHMIGTILSWCRKDGKVKNPIIQ